ncbi:CaiB/BaiF CoA transferase family protein [Actinomadura sp.]|uniref:CaiB/BaiF CoA transferase family protein n=1 Tax=Actinomadura sp. TaxID=1989 RepID=UPI0037C616BA
MPTSEPRTPRVADFSTHYSGPIASRHLVQVGADVIKIEGPRVGDGNRGLPPMTRYGDSINHLYLNAGARSLTVHTRSPAWPDVVAAVARWADIVIVGNRPSLARKRGIDFGSLVRHNPQLVYTLITGYGLDGPLADSPAHGLQMDLLAGGVPITWNDGQPEIAAGYRSSGTTLAGIEAALGSLAALHRRDRGLGAQFVHVSIWESALSWLWRDLTTYAANGEPWTDYRDLGPRYRTYAGSDDEVLLVCPMEKHFWERFCDVLELPAEFRARGDWSGGSDYGTNYEGEYEAIRDRLRTRPAAEWNGLLTAADVPVALVADWRKTMTSEHAAVNGVMTEYEYRGRTVSIPTTPVSVSSEVPPDADDAELARRHRSKDRWIAPPPDLGEHTAQVLDELGISHLASKLSPGD